MANAELNKHKHTSDLFFRAFAMIYLLSILLSISLLNKMIKTTKKTPKLNNKLFYLI